MKLDSKEFFVSFEWKSYEKSRSLYYLGGMIDGREDDVKAVETQFKN